MKIKLESDGSIPGTRVINAATGEPIEGVCAITWEWERGYPASIRITLDSDTEADLSLTLDGRVARLH